MNRRERIRREKQKARNRQALAIVALVALVVAVFGIFGKIDADHAERLRKANAHAMAQCIEEAHGDLDACEWQEKRDKHGDLYKVEVIRKK